MVSHRVGGARDGRVELEYRGTLLQTWSGSLMVCLTSLGGFESHCGKVAWRRVLIWLLKLPKGTGCMKLPMS